MMSILLEGFQTSPVAMRCKASSKLQESPVWRLDYGSEQESSKKIESGLAGTGCAPDEAFEHSDEQRQLREDKQRQAPVPSQCSIRSILAGALSSGPYRRSYG
ncbi:hypothetical protein XI03_20430 [Bradyrhizobium sp. CCBAU 65884]|nr:hypothetical protein [Bradyrhizobium sp. CCBAU 65884]